MKTKLITLATVTLISFSGCSRGPEWKKEFEQQISAKLDGQLKIKSVEIEQQKNSSEFAYIITTTYPEDLYEIKDGRPPEAQKKGYQLWKEYEALTDELQKKAKRENINTSVYERVGKKGDTVTLKGFGIAKGMKGNWQIQALSMEVEGEVSGKKLPEDGVIAGTREADELIKKAIEAQDAFEERLKSVQEEAAREEEAKRKADEEAKAAAKAREERIGQAFIDNYPEGSKLLGEWEHDGNTGKIGLQIVTRDERPSVYTFEGYLFDPDNPDNRKSITGKPARDGDKFQLECKTGEDGADFTPPNRARRGTTDDYLKKGWSGYSVRLHWMPEEGVFRGETENGSKLTLTRKKD